MGHVDFRQFDMSSIPARSNSLVYGKRNSGKTTLLCNLISVVHVDYPLGCAISPSASVRLELAKHMPSSLIWPEFDLAKLTSVVSKFTESTMPDWMENINNQRAHEVKADLLNWLLLMDDVGYDEKRFQHMTFRNMYMNGRQIGLGTILNLQKLKSLPPGLRGQLDFAFFFRDLSFKNQENIHREFFSFLPFPTFRELYLKCTEGYNCIVLDINRAQRMKDLGHSPKSLTECIFVCSCKPLEQPPPPKPPVELLGPFQMFDKFVWKLDIAWKRLLKKRMLEAELKKSTEPTDASNDRGSVNGKDLLFQPRIAEPSATKGGVLPKIPPPSRQYNPPLQRLERREHTGGATRRWSTV